MTGTPTLPETLAYVTDAAQRSLLFLDVMHARGLQAEAQAGQTVPNVLDFKAELVCDGRTLARPVNYLLVRILPKGAAETDPLKRPFVVVDPRAGHGPGIGGFKADSEIGVAMKAGHPCYFIGFLPEPMPGQTIEDVAMAEAVFLEKVIAAHPLAEGKPTVIGNCQAGWAMMMLAALRPELFGPIIVAGSPLSYWAGVEGRYPMRYSGGLLGGSWLTALASDLGAGRFDGGHLVQNFENQNPANTLWSKQYNLWSKIDGEAERYLGFEKWWGGHVALNAEEIQFTVDELFIGNKLAAGEIRTSDGTRIDLRNIRSPILCFCSQGDNITPPQQALDWILDLYDSVDEIRAHGQTIVYAIHDSIGHLGIFVSGAVAKKEHDEFASNIDMIDVLPPGLYQAILTPRNGDPLAEGDWIMRCEMRDLDDIRALGGNTLADERMFEAAAKLSEINLALYRTFAQPAVRALVTPAVAAAIGRLSPQRAQQDIFGSRNPFMAVVSAAADRVRADRKPLPPDNPWLAWQASVSDAVVKGLEGWRMAAEKLSEDSFRRIYGAEALQSALGVDIHADTRPKKAAKDPLHRQLIDQRIAELGAGMVEGGLREASLRALLHVGMARGAGDERGFAAIRALRAGEMDAADRLSLPAFKALVRQQFLMLVIDEAAALAALPGLLPADADARSAALARIRQVQDSIGPLEGEAALRMQRIEAIFTPPQAGGRKPGPIKAVAS